MKLKTTLLFPLTALLICSCSQRSYVMSFQPVNTPNTGYAVPRGLDPSSTAPNKVREPEEPTKIRTEKRSVYDSRSPQNEQATVRSEKQVEVTAEDIVEDDFTTAVVASTPAVSTTTSSKFTGNESEHIKFAYYNPFVDGSSFSLDLTAITPNFCYPIAGRFSSGYGAPGRAHHSGVDLVAPALTPIYAAFDGTVRLAKPYSGYGNVIVVRHDNGLETVYAHNTRNLVKVGDMVERGQKIALCGRTGRATTEHLHFEVRIIGQTINPLLLIDAKERTIQNGILTVSKNSSGGISAKLVKTNTVQPEQKTVTHTNVGENKIEAKVEKETEDQGAVKPGPAASPRASKGVRVGDKIYDAPTSGAKPTSDAKYYTIASGDTLYSIAKKHSTTVAALCELNNITKNTIIKSGKKLRVK